MDLAETHPVLEEIISLLTDTPEGGKVLSEQNERRLVARFEELIGNPELPFAIESLLVMGATLHDDPRSTAAGKRLLAIAERPNILDSLRDFAAKGKKMLAEKTGEAGGDGAEADKAEFAKFSGEKRSMPLAEGEKAEGFTLDQLGGPRRI